MDYSGKNTISAIGDFVKGKIPTVSNPNLLINPDFRINQHGITGTVKPVTSPGIGNIHTYFILLAIAYFAATESS